jgi:hypothetical protein
LNKRQLHLSGIEQLVAQRKFKLVHFCLRAGQVLPLLLRLPMASFNNGSSSQPSSTNTQPRVSLQIDIPIEVKAGETRGRGERWQGHSEDKADEVNKPSPNEVGSFPFQDNNQSFDSITDGLRNISKYSKIEANEYHVKVQNNSITDDFKNISIRSEISANRPSNPIAKTLSSPERNCQFRPISSNDIEN